MIQLEGVHKIYKGAYYETHALRNICLQIKQGDFVAIVGESGSGKTTLLNLLGGIDTPTSGSVSVQGMDITAYNARQLDRYRKDYIGFIFQHFALLEQYTIYENIEASLLARNVKGKLRKEKIQRVAQQLGLENLMNQYPSQISGGQKQRVAIGRTLVVDNPILLADEPTGALDSENTENVMKILREIHNKDKITVIITHDPVAAAYADYCIELRDGRIIN